MSRKDIESILQVPRNLDAALRLLDAFEKTIQLLAQHPKLGAHPSFLTAERHAKVRFQILSPFPNYLIFYQETEDGIEVLHILHGAQDTPDIFDT